MAPPSVALVSDLTQYATDPVRDQHPCVSSGRCLDVGGEPLVHVIVAWYLCRNGYWNRARRGSPTPLPSAKVHGQTVVNAEGADGRPASVSAHREDGTSTQSVRTGRRSPAHV